jgi:anti-sigma regulatory factor (Ser/Thr protein kinase)
MKTYELTVDATLDNLRLVNAFLEEHLEEADCPLKAQMQISVAAEEIYVNIAHYAYAPETGTVTLRLELQEEPPAVTLTFLDSGIPFNPLDRTDPDVSLPAEEREIGGLGIFMTRKSMDDLRYEFRDGQNVLTLTKRL